MTKSGKAVAQEAGGGSQKICPVILSGGSGQRLWPLSRSMYPKQLLCLHGEDTMLQATVGRVTDGARFQTPLIVGNEEHRFILAEQLRLMGVAPDIILEPAGRNTAPAIALAALRIAGTDADAVMLVLPSDHVIGKPEAFASAVANGARAVRTADRLATFGITPSGPETGYGYIRLGAELAGAHGAHDVAAFVEKPDAATAQTYLNSGDYVWNSGMFMMKASAYLDELERHAPDILAACRAAMAAAVQDGVFCRPDKAAFLSSPADSIDYAVMEKTSRAAVVPVELNWSDVGSWSALWDLADKDAHSNSLQGDVLTSDVRGSYLRTEGPAIAAVGVENLIVVATQDAVLVADRSRAQDVKHIVDQLKASNRQEHAFHTVVHRPWGTYQTTDSGERFQTKRIVVKPGEKLSLQKHHHRAEHWIIVQGTALVTRGDEVIELHENESTYIPMGTVHRLENPGKIPLHLIEVQSGGYLGEDDIVRLEDTYGRS